ncbi:Uncharacterised protein [Mycobacterium tuberculosis]|nr:Uncharacterised protein [Mycobacterium tuberculosis]CKS55047.1 Uncharacterised protein [Mycobacterium tuberculosis]
MLPALTTSTTVDGLGLAAAAVCDVGGALPNAAATSARIAVGSIMLTSWPSMLS